MVILHYEENTETLTFCILYAHEQMFMNNIVCAN